MLKDTFLTIAVLGGILVASAFITNWFAGSMYIRCHGCGTLNAKRRTACRACSKDLRAPSADE